MKNKDIMKLYQGLCEISELKFKPRTSFILAKNKVALEPLYSIIVKCQRDIFEEYGEIKEDGSVLIPNDKIKEANKALEELMELDNTVQIIKISIEDFGNEVVSIDLLEKLMDIIENA